MVRIECTACPRRHEGCPGCPISALDAEFPLVGELEEESCGYRLTEPTRAAIEVLRAVGLLSEVRVVEVSAAA